LQDAAHIKEADFFKIRAHWLKFDTEDTYTLPVSQLKEFLQSLETPWGFGLAYNASEAELVKKCRDLNLKFDAESGVHFFDVLTVSDTTHLPLAPRGLSLVIAVRVLAAST
jgi:hypothetical protein